jgi:hypothetical protein
MYTIKYSLVSFYSRMYDYLVYVKTKTNNTTMYIVCCVAPIKERSVRLVVQREYSTLLLWIQFYWTSTTLSENNPYVSDTPVHIFIMGVEHV